MNLFLLSFFSYLFLPLIAINASTIPLQNIIKSQKKGFFNSSLGYAIHSENTLWKLNKTSPKGKVLIYKQKGSVFSVRVKKITKQVTEKATKPNINLYLKNSLKTYKHFGLKITKTKKIKFKNQIAYLIYSHSQKKTLSNFYSAQLLTIKNHHLVSMTCTGKKSNQKHWTSECVKIMKNFTWTN